MKKISDNNPFIRAYMKYKPITTDTLIIAHKKCIKKTFDKAIKYGRWGAYLNPDFVNHFGDLGITVKLDKDDNIDLFLKYVFNFTLGYVYINRGFEII